MKFTALRSMTQKTGFMRAVALAFMAGSSLAALGAATGCSFDQPKKKKSEAAALPIGSPAPKMDPVDPRNAGTQLLQKSVARVLGFTAVGDVDLTVLQDTESALFETLRTQLSTPGGVSPSPIFYYTPVFISGSPKLLPLADGSLNVTIPNNFTQVSVRRAINDSMSDALAAYKIKAESIGLIPMENIKVTVKAFGKFYTDGVSMDADFRTIDFKIPSADVPQLVFDALKNSAQTPNVDPGLVFLEYISQITISYDYFVQQYGSQQCSMNLTNDDIRNMYMDQTGCPTQPQVTQDKVTDALQWIRSQGNTKTAAESVNSKLAALTQATSIVTACVAGNEARKIQGAASVSCTKGGTRKQDQDGSTGYSPQVTDFLKKTIQPTMTSKIARVTDVKNWDDELIAATIAMFGSPERFKSTVDRINSEIQNKNVKEQDDDYYNKTAEFADTLKNHDTLNQSDSYVDNQGRIINQDYGQTYNNSINTNTSQNAKGGGGGINLGFGGFGVGFGSNSSNSSGSGTGSNTTNSSQNYKASDEFKREYEEFHKLARAMTLETNTEASEKVRQTSEYLYNMGFDHSIESVDGKWNIFPKLNISVKANANRSEEFAQSFKDNDLGMIVQESENIPVQINLAEDAELIILFQCSKDGSWITLTTTLDQFQWWKSEKFWVNLSERASENVFLSGCSFLGVKMYYENARDNAGMVPKNLNITFYGVTERTVTGSDGKSTTFAERSPPIAVRLGEGQASSNPIEGNIAIDAEQSGAKFTKVRISRQ